MFVETITANVVRFPFELRETSLLTLGDVEPDLREIDLIAEAFGLDVPDLDLAEQAEIEAVKMLKTVQVPEDANARRKVLRRMEREALRSAIVASREARRAIKSSDEMQARAVAARNAGDGSAGFFDTLAEDAARTSAMWILSAFCLAQKARGVSRAIGFALRGEAWAPFDIQAETEWLIASGPVRPGTAIRRRSRSAFRRQFQRPRVVLSRSSSTRGGRHPARPWSSVGRPGWRPRRLPRVRGRRSQWMRRHS